MERYYVRHESLKNIISFETIAELWNGEEKSIRRRGVEIILHTDDMYNVIADTPKSLEDGGLYESVGRGEHNEVLR